LTDTQRIADWDRQLPDYRSAIIGLISRLRLENHVEFVRAAFTDMPDLYDSADIVVYPTIQGEPYGLVPPEAMSCARPVIASRCGGITETLIDGETGWLVPPGDVGALVERISQLIKQPTLARAFGAAGRRHAAANLSAAKYTALLEERYLASLAEQEAL
jgi:glycosyltransferase involved in cell wall biosynthesis